MIISRGLEASAAVRCGAALAALLWLAGCGTNKPEIPPELLAPVDSGGGAYPAGPYGGEVGEVVEDFGFTGWRNPTEAGYDLGKLEEIRFSDYYDPDGEQYELLLANTAAVWCNPCKAEHEKLPELYGEYAPRGLVIVSALFQDAAGDPATTANLQTWALQFQSNYPLVIDPEFQMGRYASAETPPLNLLIDARTMTILEKYIGNQESVLWPFIDSQLSARGR